MNEETSFELLRIHHKEHHEFDKELLANLIKVQKLILAHRPLLQCTIEAHNIVTHMIIVIRKEGGNNE